MPLWCGKTILLRLLYKFYGYLFVAHTKPLSKSRLCACFAVSLGSLSPKSYLYGRNSSFFSDYAFKLIFLQALQIQLCGFFDICPCFLKARPLAHTALKFRHKGEIPVFVLFYRNIYLFLFKIFSIKLEYSFSFISSIEAYIAKLCFIFCFNSFSLSPKFNILR